MLLIELKQNTKKIRKQIAMTATKIGYFAQFGIFGDISGFKQSQINLIIYYILLTNCRNKSNTVFQAHTCAKVEL